jgi:hypothetical protein
MRTYQLTKLIVATMLPILASGAIVSGADAQQAPPYRGLPPPLFYN